MLTRKINSYMRHSKLWQHCTETCRRAFIREMRGNQYDFDALRDAFDWFVIGWRAADIQRTVEGISQINSEQRIPSEPVPEDLRLVRGAD